MQSSLNVAVAGCGVAGLAVATLLHRSNHRVTVFEQFEQPSPLGSGLILQPTGLSVLSSLGLGGSIAAAGAKIERLFGRAHPSGRTVLDVRYASLRGARYGLAVHRAVLFDVLYGAALAQGVDIECGVNVRAAVLAADAKVKLEFANGRCSPAFDLVIDALGVRSPLSPNPGTELAYGALWANLDWPAEGFHAHTLEQRYVEARKMVGVLPIGNLPRQRQQQAAFFWSLKHCDYALWLERGLGAWRDEVLALWPQTEPLLAAITAPEQLILARYAHRTLHTPVAPCVVHIGDSYHAASPQLGQGANMALLDAYALARAIDSQPTLDSALADYARRRRWHVRLYQTMSWLFTPVYQSDSTLLPLLRDLVVGPLSRIPPAPQLIAAMVAGTLGDPFRALALPERLPRLVARA